MSFDKYRFNLSSFFHFPGERRAVGTLDKFLSRGINIKKHQFIRLGQYITKITKQITRPGITMWLIYHYQAAVWPALTRSLQRRGNFTRMVAIIIHQGNLSALGQLEIAINLEASANAGKVFKGIDNGTVLYFQFRRHGYGCKCI